MARALNVRLGTDHKTVDISAVNDLGKLRKKLLKEWPVALVYVEADDLELVDEEEEDVLVDMNAISNEYCVPGGK